MIGPENQKGDNDLRTLSPFWFVPRSSQWNPEVGPLVLPKGREIDRSDSGVSALMVET